MASRNAYLLIHRLIRHLEVTNNTNLSAQIPERKVQRTVLGVTATHRWLRNDNSAMIRKRSSTSVTSKRGRHMRKNAIKHNLRVSLRFRAVPSVYSVFNTTTHRPATGLLQSIRTRDVTSTQRRSPISLWVATGDVWSHDYAHHGRTDDRPAPSLILINTFNHKTLPTAWAIHFTYLCFNDTYSSLT
jgi:hypothetical protein